MPKQHDNCVPGQSTRRTLILVSEKASGSTIFKDEIVRHPQVNPIGHTEHNEHETQYWLKAACLLGMSSSGFLHGRSFYGRAVARDKLVELIAANVPGFAAPADDERLVFEGWAALCARFGPVFFEKSPQHIQHWAVLSLLLRYIQSTDHDVRVVGLVRNPLAMVYSAWHSWGSDPRTRPSVWQQSYQNLLRFQRALEPERFLLIRYEDMCAEPTETMRRVCQFAGLSHHEEVGRGIHRRSVDMWQLDPLYTLQLDESVKAVAREYGYTDAELVNPRPPSDRLNPLNHLRSLWMRRRRTAVSTKAKIYAALKKVRLI